MIVELNVHVEIDDYKGRKGSNMRPREKKIWVRESYLFGQRFSDIF